MFICDLELIISAFCEFSSRLLIYICIYVIGFLAKALNPKLYVCERGWVILALVLIFKYA